MTILKSFGSNLEEGKESVLLIRAGSFCAYANNLHGIYVFDDQKRTLCHLYERIGKT